MGRRADGYHLLQTLFRFIDYGDTLTLRPRADGRIERTGELPGVPPEQDLTVRAAHLLREASAARAGVSIELDKRLPLGGGLGGGSSDAATTLIALNRLWGLGWTRSRLQRAGFAAGGRRPGVRVRPQRLRGGRGGTAAGGGAAACLVCRPGPARGDIHGSHLLRA